MPRIGTEYVNARLDNGERASHKFEIFVNSEGRFYANLPRKMVGYFRDEQTGRSGKMQIFRKTKDELIKDLTQCLRDVNQPEKQVELIIKYNIESHVSFAIDGEDIYPNAGYTKECRWNSCGQGDGKDMYGNHHASNQSDGGYSLTIGARALKKITWTQGRKVTVEYESYYGVDENGDELSHHETDHPAGRLNSWCSFYLNDDCKEIPYTDDAARFFNDLMLGMAKLSKLIQERTFDQENLMKLIALKTPLLAPKP